MKRRNLPTKGIWEGNHLGLKIDTGEVKQYFGQVEGFLTQRDFDLILILSGLNSFCDDQSLTGAAWITAKNFVTRVHIPLARGQILTNEKIMGANSRFASLIDSLLKNDLIDEDELQQKIDELWRQNESILERNVSLSMAFPSLSFPMDSFTVIANNKLIEEMRHDIEDIHALEAASTGLYESATQLMRKTNQGINELAGSVCFDPATGLYDLSKINMDWRKLIDRYWEIRKGIDVYGAPPYFGGNQKSPYEKLIQEDPDIINLLTKHFPTMTDTEMKAYLLKLNSEGCAYAAMANAILAGYSGSEEEFEATFGFPLYIECNGKLVYNFDALIVDIYCSTDNHHKVFGHDVVTNVEDFIGDFWVNVIDGKGSLTGAQGLGTAFPNSLQDRISLYLEGHGIDSSIKQGIKPSIDNYNAYKDTGEIIITMMPTKLQDSTGKLVEDSNMAHAVTVTGVTTDGRFIVSSWGKEYYLDPNDYDNKNLDTFGKVEKAFGYDMKVVTVG